MNIFITGCNSYIGKYLASSFIEQGNHVIGTSRINPKIRNRNFKFIKHDLSISPILKIKKKIDFFIHIAGRRHSKTSKVRDYISSNIIVSYNVQKMIKKHKPKLVIYTSSRCIYGDVKDKILSEKTNILNPDVYGQTKFLPEKIFEEVGNTVSLRMNTVLGKGAPLTETGGWIANTYKKLLLGQSVEVVDAKINNFIHVSDIFNIINVFFKKKIFVTDQFNISCSKVSTSKKLVYLMKKLLNSKSKIIQKINKQHFYTISNHKLKKYYLTLSAEEAVSKFVRDLKK